MLVLKREKGERTQIIAKEAIPAGTIINIDMIRVGKSAARLGIAAPPSFAIERPEATKKEPREPRPTLPVTPTPAA